MRQFFVRPAVGWFRLISSPLVVVVVVAVAVAASVVPAAFAAPPQVLALAGEWRFALDRAAEQTDLKTPPSSLPEGEGIAGRWFARDLPERIQLPGALQAQGHGNEISEQTPWMLGLGDAWWKLQPAELRARFSQPGHYEVPFLAQPPRHWLGAAWYQRDIDIPADWQGRRVALFLEKPHWETTVWLDERRVGSNRSLVAPHEYELGSLPPGRRRLTIRVDNRRLVVDPANDGHAVDAHSVSDALGATWNGIAGRIELRATAPVWIDDAQAFPQLAGHSARIKVKIGNLTGQPGNGTLSAGGKTVPVSWTAEGGAAEWEAPLAPDAQPWDEFHPQMQQLDVTLKSGDSDGARADVKTVRFGLREIAWRDKDLLINGRVVNLRTTHFGGDFPLTGYPATDPETWKSIFRRCQEYGLNGMRFHSWCPPEAAFAAADELGFYLQPECGMWSPFNPGSVYTRQLEEETARLLRAFGNHPSFILLSPSNEPAGRYEQVTPQWAAANYKLDPRRLYSAGTGWGRPGQVFGGAQFAAMASFGNGALRNTGGWFGGDYRAALETVHIPVLAHEVGQWCAYPDFSVIDRFTGYLRPGNYHIFQYLAEREGVLDQNKAMADASGRFQVECYKEEIEANLRTPGLAGYQLLDLHDYLGQGTALIGVTDAFWQPKSYVSGAEFRRFSGATVPLARLARRTFTADETLACPVEIAHFGEKPLEGARPYWKILDAATGRTLAQGEGLAPRDIPLGKNIPLCDVRADLSKLPAPAACKLVVGLEGLPVENDWNFWVYPAPLQQQANATTAMAATTAATVVAPADVLATSDWPAAQARLANGGKVLFTPSRLDPARSPAMKRTPVFWNIQMTVRPPRNPTPRFDAMLGLLCDAKHPALAGFPTEANCDWQWTPLINNVPSVNLREAPRELKPIVAAIDDWNRNWRLGVIFECKVGPGRLMVSAIRDDAATAGARQLRRSLLDYMAGDKFQPTVEIAPEQIVKLWQIGGALPAPGQRVFDPDLNDGTQP